MLGQKGSCGILTIHGELLYSGNTEQIVKENEISLLVLETPLASSASVRTEAHITQTGCSPTFNTSSKPYLKTNIVL